MEGEHPSNQEQDEGGLLFYLTIIRLLWIQKLCLFGAIFCLFAGFETESYLMVLTGLELILYTRLTLKLWFFLPHLLNAGIASLCRHADFSFPPWGTLPIPKVGAASPFTKDCCPEP